MKQKRPKRFVVTAWIVPDASKPDILAREFFTYPNYVDDMTENAARHRFAKKRRGVVPEDVQISTAPERKINPSFRVTGKSESSALYNERRAELYAAWLAKRDGVTLPTDGRIRAAYNVCQGATKTQSRISAVYFGSVKITIPHWDWTPAEPVEEICDAVEIAPAMISTIEPAAPAPIETAEHVDDTPAWKRHPAFCEGVFA